MVTDVYRIRLVDMERKGYLLLKHPKSVKTSINVGDNYLADKVKLAVNTH